MQKQEKMALKTLIDRVGPLLKLDKTGRNTWQLKKNLASER